VYTIWKCGACGLEFCDPMPSESNLERLYTDYFDPRAQREVVRENARRNIAALREYGLTSESRLLDFGSGQGAFCQEGGSSNWRNYDPYTQNTDRNEPPAGDYDWITLWGVLEHLCEPMKHLAEFGRWLRPDGMLAMTTVWTEGSIPYRHKPPEHVTYWTKDAMQTLLERNGFSLVWFEAYRMMQKSEVYLNAVLRTVPADLRSRIHHTLPEMVEVPTNEAFIVAKRGDHKKLP